MTKDLEKFIELELKFCDKKQKKDILWEGKSTCYDEYWQGRIDGLITLLDYINN